MPEAWECVEWKARGGYGSQGNENSVGHANAKRERIWFSPHCLSTTLFSELIGEPARGSHEFMRRLGAQDQIAEEVLDLLSGQ